MNGIAQCREILCCSLALASMLLPSGQVRVLCGSSWSVLVVGVAAHTYTVFHDAADTAVSFCHSVSILNLCCI
jgi:hypothetical protein